MKQLFILLASSCLLTACNNEKTPAAVIDTTGRKPITTIGPGPTAEASVGDTTGKTAISQLDGNWELDYISGPRIAFNGLYPDAKPQINFITSKLTFSGNSSCNNYSGRLDSLDGNRIRFAENFMTTRMACQGGGEQIFFNTLKKISSWSVSDDNTLNLLTGNVAMMRFKRK